MRFANVTLIVFVICVILDVLALFLDLLLYACEQETITEWVWRHPVLGVPLVLVQVMLVVSLALHFWLLID